MIILAVCYRVFWPSTGSMELIQQYKNFDIMYIIVFFNYFFIGFLYIEFLATSTLKHDLSITI